MFSRIAPTLNLFLPLQKIFRQANYLNHLNLYTEINMPALVFAFLFGALAGATVAYFWDDIKEWASNAIRSILRRINQALNAVSDAIIYLSKQAGRIYKKIAFYSREIYSGVMRKHERAEEISSYDIPEEMLEQLNTRTEVLLGRAK